MIPGRLAARRRVHGEQQAAAPAGRAVGRQALDLAHEGIDLVRTCGLAAEAGHAQLQIAPALHGGHNTLGGFAHKGVAAIASELVPIETLDALAERLSLGKVDAIKIDVEGAEMKVLTGGRELLKSSRPALLIEANEDALRKQATSTGEMLALLRSLDYEIFVFSDATGLAERWIEDAPLSANIVARQ